ncbi:hypothetical protein AQZ52_15985 [Novosphingobium fuchskuhlense]|uniref:Uncharacterized protein n=1 Tax=Novosphingobium fuchskuhlense TaxID=1117702 RepID=A0A124JTM6_9SPHN|nr:hypothetical protein [Novosphingobium fuchskuhlense]KUR70342.1 hypothetical protein AQZ52_15985 [Novosphingobium fuchskuhlense]
MALSNAERQRRYRQKLKVRASPEGVADQVRAAVERAIHALWAFHQRPGPGGTDWAEIDGCQTLAQYRSELERSPGNLVQAVRAFLPDFAGLTPEEARAIAVVIDLSDALRIAPPRHHAARISSAAHPAADWAPAADRI